MFGYYLEVRNMYKDKVPENWVRKQTLAQAERYITEELKAYEEKILGADERIMMLEDKLFRELIVDMQPYIPQIQLDANLIAHLDCLLGFAQVAEENQYVRPQIDATDVLDIKQGRHPVIEMQLPLGETYVPNDIYLDTEKQQVMMITGPNMAGKSALLRQTALIVHIGADRMFRACGALAKIGLVDKIFTRVGASDNISLGESTFMVEMTEAANILNNVTNRSLVLFDELGRGTSTYDGISIAWAIVEYLHEQPRARARTLFATHYHELNEMEKHFPRIHNYNVSVKEADGKVIFMRKLERGGSEHSFGIHVAEIAGMPRSIVKRSNVILKQLEADNSRGGFGGQTQRETLGREQGRHAIELLSAGLTPVLCQVRDEILGLDINNLTPMEALNKLNEIKKIIGAE
ncbi:MAG: DNA mismatch repair protein MutS [Hoylesella buccalis]